MNIDKSPSRFPIKNQYNFLAHCSVSHLYQPAADVAKHCIDRQVLAGRQMLFEYAGESNGAVDYMQLAEEVIDQESARARIQTDVRAAA